MSEQFWAGTAEQELGLTCSVLEFKEQETEADVQSDFLGHTNYGTDTFENLWEPPSIDSAPLHPKNKYLHKYLHK